MGHLSMLLVNSNGHDLCLVPLTIGMVVQKQYKSIQLTSKVIAADAHAGITLKGKTTNT